MCALRSFFEHKRAQSPGEIPLSDLAGYVKICRVASRAKSRGERSIGEQSLVAEASQLEHHLTGIRWEGKRDHAYDGPGIDMGMAPSSVPYVMELIPGAKDKVNVR